MVPLPLSGGCQCGALRYEIRQAPLMAYNCHCTNCQRIGGGAFSTPITVLEDAFVFTQGEPRTFEAPPPAAFLAALTALRTLEGGGRVRRGREARPGP